MVFGILAAIAGASEMLESGTKPVQDVPQHVLANAQAAVADMPIVRNISSEFLTVPGAAKGTGGLERT